MPVYRILLAAMVSVALAAAPIGTALAASQMAAKNAKVDCHGKAVQDGKVAKDCQCCDVKATCSGDTCRLKCHKLQATLVMAPKVLAFVFVLGLPPDPQKPPDRLSGPELPPPRS